MPQYTCHVRWNGTSKSYRHRNKLPDLVGLLVVRIQNSTSIVSGAGVLEVYNAAGVLDVLNPEQDVSDDLFRVNMQRRRKGLKRRKPRTNNENIYIQVVARTCIGNPPTRDKAGNRVIRRRVDLCNATIVYQAHIVS